MIIMELEVACGVMFDSNKKLMIGLRKDNYIWEFPGGKKESNESIEECLKREWKEELNLEINIEKEICSYSINNNQFICKFFIGKIIDIENIRMNVHAEINLVNKEELYKYKHYPEDIKVINLLQNIDIGL